MKNQARMISAALLLVAATTSAEAVKLTNRDAVDHKIVVIEGDKKNTITVKAGAEIGLCDTGCVVEIESGEQFELTGTEIVSYEDNFLYDDSPVPEEGPMPGGEGEPPVGGMNPPGDSMAPAGEAPKM